MATLSLEDAAALATAVADTVTVGRFCTLAAWVLLLYDHIIHFDKEVELFWSKPWSIAKGLYFFNRYSSPVFLGIHSMIFLSPHVSDGLCLSWFKFEGYTGTIGIAAVEMILGFRVLALWNRDKWITAIVCFALLAEITTMLTILSSAYVNMLAISQPHPSIPYQACIPLNVPPYFFAFWLPPLGYEFLVFGLASFKGYTTLRYSFAWGTGEFTFRSTGSRLLEVMIRDSLWYFLLIFACDMVCSLIWLQGPATLLQAVVGFGLVIPSVAGSHLLLNLRDAYYHPTGNITTANTTGWTATANNGKKGTPTFGRSKNILASGGRHQVAQLDTQWALDPEQDDIAIFSDAAAARKMDDDADCETLPTGSQRSQHAKASGGSTILTTATISTFDSNAQPHAGPLAANGAADAYVYTTRRLDTAGGAGEGPRLDLETGTGTAAGRHHEGESYELQHVRSATSTSSTQMGTTTAIDVHESMGVAHRPVRQFGSLGSYE